MVRGIALELECLANETHRARDAEGGTIRHDHLSCTRRWGSTRTTTWEFLRVSNHAWKGEMAGCTAGTMHPSYLDRAVKIRTQMAHWDATRTLQQQEQEQAAAGC